MELLVFTHFCSEFCTCELVSREYEKIVLKLAGKVTLIPQMSRAFLQNLNKFRCEWHQGQTTRREDKSL